MSRSLVALLAVVVVCGLVGAAVMAADAPADQPLRGKVVSVDADKGTVVVKPRQGDNVTVATDKDTKVTLDGKDAKLADLKAGMMVSVSPATGVAKTIAAMTEALRGKVVSVDAANNKLVVKTMGKKGEDVTVTTDKDTKVTVDGKEATLANVKADMFVAVTPVTGTAKTIVANVARAKSSK